MGKSQTMVTRTLSLKLFLRLLNKLLSTTLKLKNHRLKKFLQLFQKRNMDNLNNHPFRKEVLMMKKLEKNLCYSMKNLKMWRTNKALIRQRIRFNLKKYIKLNLQKVKITRILKKFHQLSKFKYKKSISHLNKKRKAKTPSLKKINSPKKQKEFRIQTSESLKKNLMKD